MRSLHLPRPNLRQALLGLLACAVAAPAAALTATPTAPPCPMATPEPLWVDPVLSPTSESSQVIRVYAGNAERIEVFASTGLYVAEGDFGVTTPAEIVVPLFPGVTNELEVVAHVRTVVVGPCTFGGYTLRTRFDRFGAPLAIEQQEAPPVPVVRDFSDFGRFAFSRAPARGFCPPLDAVFDAEIEAGAAGEYTLRLSVLRRGLAGVDDCIATSFFLADCRVPEPQPERALEPAEIARVLEVFAAVRTYPEVDPTCTWIAYDPCLVNVARWDEHRFDDHPCTAPPRTDETQIAALVALLDELRQDVTATPTPTPTPTVEAPSPTAMPSTPTAAPAASTPTPAATGAVVAATTGGGGGCSMGTAPTRGAATPLSFLLLATLLGIASRRTRGDSSG